MIRKTIILCIKGYQKFISPKKGFTCAHSKLHGGTGCSGAVIKIIQEVPLVQWKEKISNRFESCKQSSMELKKERSKKEGKCSKCLPDIEDCGDCGDIF